MIAMRHISQLFKTYMIKERRHDCNIKPLPKYKRGRYCCEIQFSLVGALTELCFGVLSNLRDKLLFTLQHLAEVGSLGSLL